MAMEDSFGEEDLANVAIGSTSHRFSHPLKIEQESDSTDGVDSISSLPEDILHRILSLVPTNIAIRTSVLSKRWRHVWSKSPYLCFDQLRISPASINETLNNYSATNITSFHLVTSLLKNRIHFVDRWIEFAISHGAVNLTLEFRDSRVGDYKFPEFFYTNSSVQQLLIIINSGPVGLIPSCNVSWTSLKYLSLSSCRLSDETFPKILSGCPVLESLRLQNYGTVKFLDLSESRLLRRLDLDCCSSVREPTKIVGPHIHYLRLRAQCTLLDVSSLIEANVDSSVNYLLPSISYHEAEPLKLAIVQAMLDKLQNVDKLTLGVEFLRILSKSELNGVLIPTLKVKTLTLETMILRPVVPGIIRLVQNSPEVKKITIYTMQFSTVLDKRDSFVDFKNMNPDQGWRSLDHVVFPTLWDSKVPEPELMVSFMELLLANAITLETLVVRLGSYTDRSRFEEQFQIALTLSHYNNEAVPVR
ncbi:PREDICTED: F-box/LRR-repeat protein 25-like [Camelina sativa]|uniref:F-box/LRR-repeat protein 25-like n=1 Tax=Camelina sativa TaxID=90675 RepID=A0ABM0Y3X5_CAMSA|nr:PREDICTED: F-box/LRR-repeat protein 25-like [Camelina sativa]